MNWDNSLSEYRRIRLVEGVGARQVENAAVAIASFFAYLHVANPAADLADVTDADAARWLEDVKRSQSVSTTFKKFSHLRLYFRWAARSRRIEYNPLDGMCCESEAEWKQTRPRRVLSREECVRLLEATERGGIVRNGWPAPERAFLYRVAMQTGQRRGSLFALAARDFEADGGTLTLITDPAHHKSGKRIRVPIIGELADELWTRLEGASPLDALFPLATPYTRTAVMVAEDCAAAGIGPDAAGRKVDFHSLRGTCATLMVDAGVDILTTSKILGHSSTATTARYYVSTDDAAKSKAIEKTWTKGNGKDERAKQGSYPRAAG